MGDETSGDAPQQKTLPSAPVTTRRQARNVRGTQTFVGTLSECWRRPGVTALEVAWRWTIGVPALVLVWLQVQKVLLTATGGTLDPARLGLDSVLLNDPVGALSADPVGAAQKFAGAWTAVLPGLEHVGIWLVPLLLVAWVAASCVGRTLVLRRIDPLMHARVGTLLGLQALRIAALATVCWVWFAAMGWIGRTTVTGPIAAGQEPQLVLCCGLAIVLSLGMFVAWGTVSWVLSMAQLLAMLENLGVGASLRRTSQLGSLRAKLVEVNLVMGIVKIAIIVLAMVISATPLPFESVTTPGFLAIWWSGVGVVYLLASDFFHVARLVAYLTLWRTYEGEAI